MTEGQNRTRKPSEKWSRLNSVMEKDKEIIGVKKELSICMNWIIESVKHSRIAWKQSPVRPLRPCRFRPEERVCTSPDSLQTSVLRFWLQWAELVLRAWWAFSTLLARSEPKKATLVQTSYWLQRKCFFKITFARGHLGDKPRFNDLSKQFLNNFSSKVCVCEGGGELNLDFYEPLRTILLTFFYLKGCVPTERLL